MYAWITRLANISINRMSASWIMMCSEYNILSSLINSDYIIVITVHHQNALRVIDLSQLHIFKQSNLYNRFSNRIYAEYSYRLESFGESWTRNRMVDLFLSSSSSSLLLSLLLLGQMPPLSIKKNKLLIAWPRWGLATQGYFSFLVKYLDIKKLQIHLSK